MIASSWEVLRLDGRLHARLHQNVFPFLPRFRLEGGGYFQAVESAIMITVAANVPQGKPTVVMFNISLHST